MEKTRLRIIVASILLIIIVVEVYIILNNISIPLMIGKEETSTPWYLKEYYKVYDSSERITAFNKTIIFTNLAPSTAYIFTKNGLKQYNGSYYGLASESIKNRPGLLIGEISIDREYENAVVVCNLSYKGVSDYVLNIYIVNKDTGYKKHIPILHDRPTIQNITLAKGTYNIYVYGWITTSKDTDTILINYFIDFRKYV